eukprot:4456921-Pleurochrysis_carterae.AAC.1
MTLRPGCPLRLHGADVLRRWPVLERRQCSGCFLVRQDGPSAHRRPCQLNTSGNTSTLTAKRRSADLDSKCPFDVRSATKHLYI